MRITTQNPIYFYLNLLVTQMNSLVTRHICIHWEHLMSQVKLQDWFYFYPIDRLWKGWTDRLWKGWVCLKPLGFTPLSTNGFMILRCHKRNCVKPKPPHPQVVLPSMSTIIPLGTTRSCNRSTTHYEIPIQKQKVSKSTKWYQQATIPSTQKTKEQEGM